MKIADREFDVRPLSEFDEAIYRRWIAEKAQELDRPLERFCSRLGNISQADRAAAITAFLARPDWDTPPAGLLKQVEDSWAGVISLALAALSPRPELEWLKSVITEDNRDAIHLQILAAIQVALAGPTAEEILARNAAIKQKIAEAQHE